MKLNNKKSIFSFLLGVALYCSCLRGANLLNSQGEKEHLDYAKSLNQRGVISNQKGKHAEALKYHEKALEIYQKTLNKKDVSNAVKTSYAITFYHIGRVKYGQNKYSEAIDLFEKALEVHDKINDYSSYYGSTLFSLGLIYLNQAEYKKAMFYYQRALKNYEQTLGNESNNYARTLSDIASVYDDQEQYEQAIIYFRKASVIYYKKDQKGAYATTLHNIGIVYRNQKKYKEAIKCYKESLEVHQSMPQGKQSPGYARTLCHLEEIYLTSLKGNRSNPIPFTVFGEGIENYKQNLNKKGPFYLKRHALICFRNGKFEEAIIYQKDLLAFYKKQVGEKHPKYALTAHNLAVIYHYKKEYNSAIQYYDQALAIRKKQLGTNHKDYLDTLQRRKAACEAKSKQVPKTVYQSFFNLFSW